jgi:CspA family cold shock protein
MNAGAVRNWISDKGYGFIVPDTGGPDLFVHYSGIIGTGHRELYPGQRVKYGLVLETDRGPQAIHVYGLIDMPSEDLLQRASSAAYDAWSYWYDRQWRRYEEASKDLDIVLLSATEPTIFVPLLEHLRDLARGQIEALDEYRRTNTYGELGADDERKLEAIQRTITPVAGTIGVPKAYEDENTSGTPWRQRTWTPPKKGLLRRLFG